MVPLKVVCSSNVTPSARHCTVEGRAGRHSSTLLSTFSRVRPVRCLRDRPKTLSMTEKLRLVLCVMMVVAVGGAARTDRLRDLSALPKATTVKEAAQLHTLLTARGSALRAAMGLPSFGGASFGAASPSPLTTEAMLRCIPASAPPAATTVTPTAFGGDPTGVHDSTDSLVKAVEALMTICVAARAEPSTPHHLAFNITDCGGATLDLQGGAFLISKPVVLPPWVGNLHVRSTVHIFREIRTRGCHWFPRLIP
jgi:hypothetical protein